MKQITLNEEVLIEVDGIFYKVRCDSISVEKHEPEQPKSGHYRFLKMPDTAHVTMIGYPIETPIPGKYQ